MRRGAVDSAFWLAHILALEYMRLIEIHQSLSDPTRSRILHLLGERPLCVGHLQRLLQAGQVHVSKHLAYLRKRGLVEARRQGQMMVYCLPEPQPRELALQLRCLRDCAQSEPLFQEDLNRLEALRAEGGLAAAAQPPQVRQPVRASEPEPERPPVWPTEGLVD